MAPLLEHNPGEILNTFGEDGWELVSVAQIAEPDGRAVHGRVPEAPDGRRRPALDPATAGAGAASSRSSRSPPISSREHDDPGAADASGTPDRDGDAEADGPVAPVSAEPSRFPGRNAGRRRAGAAGGPASNGRSRSASRPRSPSGAAGDVGDPRRSNVATISSCGAGRRVRRGSRSGAGVPRSRRSTGRPRSAVSDGAPRRHDHAARMRRPGRRSRLAARPQLLGPAVVPAGHDPVDLVHRCPGRSPSPTGRRSRDRSRGRTSCGCPIEYTGLSGPNGLSRGQRSRPARSAGPCPPMSFGSCARVGLVRLARPTRNSVPSGANAMSPPLW